MRSRFLFAASVDSLGPLDERANTEPGVAWLGSDWHVEELNWVASVSSASGLNLKWRSIFLQNAVLQVLGSRSKHTLFSPGSEDIIGRSTEAASQRRLTSKPCAGGSVVCSHSHVCQ